MRLGDLDELKSEFDIIANNSEINEWQTLPIKHIKQIIDNTPSVEQEVYMTGKDYNLYLEGYKQAKKDFRPKGEWSITDETDEFYGRVYRCTHCGKEMLACGCRNFCTWCGADMRSKGE